MKSKLLSILSEAYPEHISGQKLSEILNCSRTAVWKHISQLKEEGYQISAVRNKGYLLEAAITPFSGHSVQSRLTAGALDYEVKFSPVLESTQVRAQQLATEGAKEGTLVITDHQSGGRGRLGRMWKSAQGTGIAASLILKPAIPMEQVPQITLVAAVTVAKLLRSYDIQARIKWPNDILVDDKKVCGILTEMQADPDGVKAVIIGIGLNVNELDFPKEIEEKAISLKKIKNIEYDRSAVTADLFNLFAEDYLRFTEKSFAVFKDDWIKLSATIGKNVSVLQNNKNIKGKAVAIENNGALKIITADGNEHLIYSGDLLEQ